MLFALFLILLFSSHIASLCAKKTGEIFICKFFNCAKADFKKRGLVLHFILYCRFGVAGKIFRCPRYFEILKPARLGLSKMDSAQSVNNGYKKYPLFF